jgi:hypothetical protein
MKLLLAGLAVLAVVLRSGPFAEGGSVGAWACSIVFLAAFAGLLALVARDAISDARGRRLGPSLKWMLVMASLLALVVIAVSDDETLESLATLVFVFGLLAAAVLAVVQWRRRSGAPPR